MKLIKTLSGLLILSLVFSSVAEAKGRSFGGGFRSQRTAPAPQRVAPQKAAPAPAAPTTQSKSMFGSFGTKPAAAGATPSAAPQNAQPLNMSKDLNANAAQGNAFKAKDARNGAGAAASGVAATGNSGWFRSGNPKAAQTAPMQPAMQQRSGGGFMNNMMFFMLGSSIANSLGGNHRTHYNQANPSAVTDTNSQAIDPPTGMAAPAEEQESFFMKLLRWAVWGGIIFGIYKLVSYIRRAKNPSASKKPNYTFGN